MKKEENFLTLLKMTRAKFSKGLLFLKNLIAGRLWKNFCQRRCKTCSRPWFFRFIHTAPSTGCAVRLFFRFSILLLLRNGVDFHAENSQKLYPLFRRETVLCIAALLALLSVFFVPPSAVYISYIDWDTLALLFSLMAVMKGFQKAGLFVSWEINC